MRKGALLVGYARVSKADDQDTTAQVKALRLAGCKRIFEEKVSGGRWERPQLHKALEQLREGERLPPQHTLFDPFLEQNKALAAASSSGLIVHEGKALRVGGYALGGDDLEPSFLGRE